MDAWLLFGLVLPFVGFVLSITEELVHEDNDEVCIGLILIKKIERINKTLDVDFSKCLLQIFFSESKDICKPSETVKQNIISSPREWHGKRETKEDA